MQVLQEFYVTVTS
jgi:predicted nucleic acid-binding protein